MDTLLMDELVDALGCEHQRCSLHIESNEHSTVPNSERYCFTEFEEITIEQVGDAASE